VVQWLFNQAVQGKYRGERISNVTVDEVQDFTLSEIRLL